MFSLTERIWHQFTVYKLTLEELLSSKRHTNSFNATRASYIRSRTANICFGWALLVLLWIPLDTVLISDSSSLAMLTQGRFVLAITLIAIGFTSLRQTTLQQARLSLFFLVLAVNLFYVFTNFLFEFPGHNFEFESTYALLPIIHVVMLTIFPLTAIESLLLMAITAIFHLAVDYMSGSIMAPQNLSAYWIQTVLSVLVIWSQISQLHMILRMYRQANLDPLTGIYNRRMLLQLANNAILSCQLKEMPLSILLLDLDKFKRINDEWGHPTGDAVLQALTRTLQSHFRKSDIFGRYGGEEFVVFLPGCETKTAEQIAERVLSVVKEMQVPVTAPPYHLSITTSIGVASLADNDDLYTLFERADHALYKAKSSGRNQMIFMDVGERFNFEKRKSAPQILSTTET